MEKHKKVNASDYAGPPTSPPSRFSQPSQSCQNLSPASQTPPAQYRHSILNNSSAAVLALDSQSQTLHPAEQQSLSKTLNPGIDSHLSQKHFQVSGNRPDPPLQNSASFKPQHRYTRSLQLPSQISSSLNSLVQSVTSGSSPAMSYTGDHRLKRSSAGGGSGLLGGFFTKSSSSDPSSQQPQSSNPEVTLGNLGFCGEMGHDNFLSPATIVPTRDDASSTNSTTGFGQKLMSLTGLTSSASSVKDGVTSSGVSIHSPSFQSSFATAISRPTTPNRNSVSSCTSILLSPNQRSPRKSVAATVPENVELVNEFQGLDFTAIISSFLTPPLSRAISEASNDPAKVVKFDPQPRLEDLADTASNLLERLYNAYLKRTKALADAVAEQNVLREELEGSRCKVRQLIAQMERMIDEQAKEKAERDQVMLDLVQEKVKIEEGRLRREEEQEDWKEQERTRLREEIILGLRAGENIIIEAVDLDIDPSKKRVSSGGSSTGTSDSGFDSDSDSLSSLGQGHLKTSEGVNGTLQPQPLKNGKLDSSSLGEKQQYSIRMAAPSVKCESCGRVINTASAQAPSNPTQTSPLRLSTPLSSLRNAETSSLSPTSANKESTPMQSRWSFGAFRNNSNHNGVELDKLRTENKALRARVGDLECSVSEVLGILGGWREVNF